MIIIPGATATSTTRTDSGTMGIHHLNILATSNY